MKKTSFWKKYKFGIVYALLLTAMTVYAVLDVFVIPHRYGEAAESNAGETTAELASEGTVIAESAGSDTGSHSESHTHGGPGSGHRGEWGPPGDFPGDRGSSSSREAHSGSGTAELQDQNYAETAGIEIKQYRYMDTTVYVADVTVSDAGQLTTAFAEDTYGRNVKAAVSEIAADHNAVLAINGDFYGARDRGYVIRNGVLYRESGDGNEDLVIYKDGSFGIIRENEVSAQELLQQGAEQVLSFGPALLENGEIVVDSEDEVGRAMASNPRTAIGIVEPQHYLLVVSDGRTEESMGLTLSELAAFMQQLGAETAYNLDGGGSSTMVYQGSVVNQPTTGGEVIRERSVSDIVYIKQ